MELKREGLPQGLAGLQYIREDGVVCARDADEQWLVGLRADGKVSLKRYCNGVLNETYALQAPDQAMVSIAAVLSGYQPPRSLLRRDTPTG